MSEGSVDFHGYGVIYQRVWERLAALYGERVTQAPTNMGLDPDTGHINVIL